MKIHSREMLVRAAEQKLKSRLLEWAENYRSLTLFETLQVLNSGFSGFVGGILKYEIRFERHGDRDKPGGSA